MHCHLCRCLLLLRQELRQHRILFRLGQRANLRQLLRHFLAQRIQHRLKQRKPFVLVFRQRVALRIAPETHHRPQMFQPQQMFAPLAVNGLQQNLLFDVAHGVRPKGRYLFVHRSIAFLDDPFAHHVLVNAFFGGPIRNRQNQTHAFCKARLQGRCIPLIGIRFRRHIPINQIFDHLMAHILGNFAQVFGLHNLQPLAENRFALIVHHVVKLQQLLANVEVAPFYLGLRLLKALVHPRVHNRLAFFHAKAGQNLIQPLRSKNPHQIVFKA